MPDLQLLFREQLHDSEESEDRNPLAPLFSLLGYTGGFTYRQLLCGIILAGENGCRDDSTAGLDSQRTHRPLHRDTDRRPACPGGGRVSDRRRRERLPGPEAGQLRPDQGWRRGGAEERCRLGGSSGTTGKRQR